MAIDYYGASTGLAPLRRHHSVHASAASFTAYPAPTGVCSVSVAAFFAIATFAHICSFHTLLVREIAPDQAHIYDEDPSMLDRS